jgi:hypothetical protein
MTPARQHYNEKLSHLVTIVWPAWEKELDEMEQYIQRQQDEGKPVVFLQTRLNNQVKRMAAIKEVLQAAGEAVNEIPARQDGYQQANLQHSHTRGRICDLPTYSNERYLEKIYNLLLQLTPNNG